MQRVLIVPSSIVAVLLWLLVAGGQQSLSVLADSPQPRASNPPALLANAGLDQVNLYRSIAGLPPVTENVTWSDGDYKHARYMVKNNVISHSENASLPYYTAEGADAAANGNVMVSTNVAETDAYAVQTWMQGPFHALGIIDPKLAQSGYGSYREADGGYQMAATLDVLRGRTAVPTTFPVYWPGNNRTMPILAYTGNESPDPLTSCPGYTAPTGPPIILQLGTGSVTPNVTAHSITTGGTSLNHCLFTETTYTNPNTSDQSTGRSVLGARDAVVLMPQSPLLAGQVYTVSITVGGVVHSWTFTAAGTVPTSTATRTATSGPASTATRTATSGPGPTNTPTRTATPVTVQARVAFPVAMVGHTVAGGAGISGRVTYQGAGVPNQQVTLVYCTTSGCGLAATTSTGSAGSYLFSGIPSSPASGYYYTFWENGANDTRYLYRWYGPNFTYSADTAASGGDFDIKDVKLASPANGATAQVPTIFQWNRRGIAGDSYRLLFFEPATGTVVGKTSLLGDVDHVTVTALAGGMQVGTEYGWYPAVYGNGNPDSYGVPFYYRLVTFSNVASIAGNAYDSSPGLALPAHERLSLDPVPSLPAE